jgi:patatin-like phospholipase/acyl hydrolase
MPFTTLTLGGGGTKGILHVGLLLELQKHQPLIFPGGVYGVSVGSIIATYVAFGLPINRESIEKFKHMFCPSFFIDEIDFPKLAQSYTSKGVFGTEKLCNSLDSVFSEHGINIRTTKLSDAKMPLYILASNLTKAKPTIFSGDVILVDALRCSCAIPGVFKPQILYGQVYVDGDIFCPSLDHFLQNTDNAICLSLKQKLVENNFIPSKIEEMSPVKYIHDIYSLITENFHMQTRSDRTLRLSYPKLTSMSNLKDFDLDDIFKACASFLHSFLWSKNIC